MKKITILSVMLVAIVATCVTLMSVTKTTSTNGEMVKTQNQSGLSAFAMEDSNSF